MPQAKKNRVTLRDIARLAEVSVASVSLALRDSPRISKEKKTKIAEICQEIGYVRDGRLSELMSHLRSIDKQDRGSTLAALITHPDSRDSDYEGMCSALLDSIRQEAARQGYGVDVIDMGREGIGAKRLRQILQARGISGVVVLPSDSHQALEGFEFEGFQVVGIGYEMENPTPHRVCANYLKMMDELMRDALGKGHRSVAFLPEQSQSLLSNRMLAASIDYHFSQTPGARRAPVYTGALDDADALRSWLTAHQPDLVMGSRKAYDQLGAMGYAMPEAFSFACWDVQGLPETVAGLDLRPDLLGTEAVQVVVDGINRNNLGLPKSPGIVVVDSGYRPGKTLGSTLCREAVGA